MVVIRIGPRTLIVVGLLAALALGFLAGSLRPADRVLAAGRGELAPASVVGAPTAQGGPDLSLDQAQRAIQGALAYAQQNGIRQSFAVVDAHGTLVAAAKMDGARFLNPVTAQGKALATAAYGRPSGALGDAFTQSPAFWTSVIGLGRQVVPAQGALPIMIQGVQVGAMGAGGGTSQQDEDAVRAGLAAAGLQ
jgi:uncharacterized protein GlcG (DUF336 family)